MGVQRKVRADSNFCKLRVTISARGIFISICILTGRFDTMTVGRRR